MSMNAEISWKRNLFFLWFSQFISLSAFGFSLPFMPLYLKQSGMVPAGEESKWSAWFIAAASISMMIMSPVWGALGDRYGRKMMLVRANLAGAFALYLMGMAGDVKTLIVLRLLQGAFTGTVPAAQTLISTTTPDRRQGLAIGLIMSAVNAGNMAGMFLGGECAKRFGPRISFQISGYMLLVSAILVFFLVRENFSPPERVELSQSKRMRASRDRRAAALGLMPILFVMGYVAFMQTFDSAFFSLFVRGVFAAGLGENPGLTAEQITNESYGLTGTISAVAGLAAVAGSTLAGIVLDRSVPRWIWVAAGAGAGIGGIIMGVSGGLGVLAAGRALSMFCSSAIASALTVWLGRMSGSSKRGKMFGWAVTARSMGWIAAPLAGAYAGDMFGWRFALGMEGLLLLPVLHLIARFSLLPKAKLEEPVINECNV